MTEPQSSARGLIAGLPAEAGCGRKCPSRSIVRAKNRRSRIGPERDSVATMKTRLAVRWLLSALLADPLKGLPVGLLAEELPSLSVPLCPGPRRWIEDLASLSYRATAEVLARIPRHRISLRTFCGFGWSLLP